MPKVYKIVHIISSLRQGGAETILVSLVKELKEFDHYVFFIHDGPLKENLSRYAHVESISGKHFIYSPIAAYRAYKKIKNLNPLCMLSSLWLANYLGRIIGFFTKIPTLCAVHTVCEHEGFIRGVLERLSPFKPACYIAVSSSVKQSLVHTRKINPALITIIPNGIDTSVFPDKPTEGTRREFVIGSVGRFVPVKNYELLITIFAHLTHRYSHIRLMLVGHGPLEQALKNQVSSLGIADKVTFIIEKPASQYYQCFDCFVQPSAYEGLSLALLEALYSELPVIVTGHNQSHDVITHQKNGLIVTPNSAEELLNALITFIEDEPTRTALKKNNRKLIQENYTRTSMADGYRTLIHLMQVQHKKLYS